MNVFKFVLPNGIQYWETKKGEYHREDGPAIIYPNNSEQWYRNNKLHRLDGPAIIWNGSSEEWFVNDEDITEEVLIWIAENSLSNWREWTIMETTLFALRFR